MSAEEPPPPDDADYWRHNGTTTRTQGRVPPHNLDAEASLLGSMLLSSDAIDAALAEGVTPGTFYAPTHAHVAAAILTLHSTGRAVDPITVGDELATDNLLEATGGLRALVDLEAQAPSSANAAQYARIIVDRARLRQLIGVGSEITQLGYDLPDDVGLAETVARDLVIRATDRPAERRVVFEDVAAAMRGEVAAVQPTILTRTDGQALIYPGLLHWLMGDPGKGKTWIEVLAAAEVITNGGTVLMLDWEGNRRIIGDRFAALGLTPEAIEDGLRYWRPPRLDRHVIADLADMVTEEAIDLACYDGVAKALARNDYDEDRAPDVLAWLELAIHPITEAGAAALVLDHLKKDKEGAGLWPRGSGAKQGEVSGAAWKVLSKVGFSRRKAGHFDLIQAKDREGYVGEDGSIVAQCYATPSDGRLDLALRPPAGGDFEPTGYMEKVSRWMEDQDDLDHITQNDIEKGAGGKAEHVRTAIAALVKHGHIDRQKVGSARHHHLVKPYREDDRPTTHDDTEKF